MPNIRAIAKSLDKFGTKRNVINWFPGHMYGGMQAMIGKLNTVDCVVEVHDARLPFTGRNDEFKKHLGAIKPRILVLNKSDLADLSRWDLIEAKLADQGDKNVLLTDSTGTQFSHNNRGYNQLLTRVVKLINESDRHNRTLADHFKIMIVGIPNVGKSTLINRLRQYHLGRGGEPAEVGSKAGVTKNVENRIKICSRPPIYSVDTPGVLMPKVTKNHDSAMRLALCSTINDGILNSWDLAEYLLKYLNKSDDITYHHRYNLNSPVKTLEELIQAAVISNPKMILKSTKKVGTGENKGIPDTHRICWDFVKAFRNGLFGKAMFD